RAADEAPRGGGPAMWVRAAEHVPVLYAGSRDLEEERGFEVRKVGGERHVLALWGHLGARWADPLCRGLARAWLSIRRGFAVRQEGPDPGSGWRARLEIQREAHSTDPVLLDYLE